MNNIIKAAEYEAEMRRENPATSELFKPINPKENRFEGFRSATKQEIVEAAMKHPELVLGVIMQRLLDNGIYTAEELGGAMLVDIIPKDLEAK